MFLFRGFYISVMGQIRDIMEKNVITIENDKTAQDAAKIIAEKDISFLVIMNEGKPQGVLSESDFVRKVAAEDKNFRNKNKSTDILSFPSSKKIKISKNTYLGDIIISYDYLNKPKSQDLKLFKEKVIKIFIHGFLHLLGFDHRKDKDYYKMLREEDILYKRVKSKLN